MGILFKPLRSEGRGGRLRLRASGVFFSVALVMAALFALSGVGSAEQTVQTATLGTQRPGNAALGGSFLVPGALAVNTSGNGGVPAGSTYLFDSNARVQQFDAAGAFVRTFGRDVVWEGQDNSAINEQQTVTVNATGGFYTLAVQTGTGAATATSGSNTVTLSPGFGSYHVGDTYSGGTGLANSRVTAVNGNQVTLSAAATGTIVATSTATEFVGATLTGDLNGTTTVSNVATTTGFFSVGQAISGANIPANTTIATVGAGTLTLSNAATGTATGVTLSTGIPYNATFSTVQGFLNALPGVGDDDIVVTGGPGGAGGTNPYTFTFSGGIFDGNDVLQLATSATNLTGSPRTAVPATPVVGGGYEICKAVSSPADQCKAASTTPATGPGSLSTAVSSIAIDQTSGRVYVYDQTNRRVSVYTAQGDFAGAFGWGVLNNAVASLQFCTTSCVAPAAFGAQAGNFPNNTPLGLAINPVDGHVYVAAGTNRRVDEFSLTFNSGLVSGVTFERGIGWDVNPGGTPALETCTTSCAAGTAPGTNAPAGQFSQPTSIVLDAAGNMFVADTPSCSATAICRVHQINAAATSASEFAAGHLTKTSGTNKATQIARDATDGHLYVAQLTADSKVQVKEFTAAGALQTTSPPDNAELTTNNAGATGLALDPANHRTYLSTGASVSTVFVLGPVPAPTVTTPVISNVTQTTATFTGSVTTPSPGGPGYNTSYRFEYSSNGVTWTRAPLAADGTLGTTAGAHAVSQDVTGLTPNTDYAVRLIAATSTSATSTSATFTTTAAAPVLSQVIADPLTDRVTLSALINPQHQATSYRFEWGTTTAYGNSIPVLFRPIGSGSGYLAVQEILTGLQPSTTYHARLVAKNATGTTTSTDLPFTTANTAGVFDTRKPELVSPADKGTPGYVGRFQLFGTGEQVSYQTAPDGNRIFYPISYGTPTSTAGGTVSYTATRTGSGWTSAQTSPPQQELTGPSNVSEYSGWIQYVSPDASCSVVASPETLTADTPTAPRDHSGTNLFTRHADGSYELLTPVVPSNVASLPLPLQGGYGVQGASEDCETVVFWPNDGAGYRYPGLNNSGLYVSDHGTLRDVGVLPDGTTAHAAAPGGDVRAGGFGDDFPYSMPWRAISSDGSRVFFTATSNDGNDAGKQALFLREGNTTIKVSGNKTSVNGTVADRDAFYQGASVDGSKVVFMANYGLTSDPGSLPIATKCAGNPPEGVVFPCALYVYDVATGGLTDISASSVAGNTNGATVAGVVAASEDLSRIYFVARGRLVAGQGKTYDQNVATDSWGLYLWDQGTLKFVGGVGSNDIKGAVDYSVGLLVRDSRYTNRWSSQTTPDGRHLIFQSQANVVGYDSGGATEAYRYAADTGQTLCLSCRRDGEPSVGDFRTSVLSVSGTKYSPPPPRAISEDGTRVFFSSPDALTTGAVDGKTNIYAWERGTTRLLNTGPADIGAGTPDANAATAGDERPRIVGASASGDDVFIATISGIDPSDTDAVFDLYDFRIGGGFPLPPAAAAPCDPVADACQGSGAGLFAPPIGTALPTPTTSPSSGRPAFGMAKVSRQARAALAAGRSVSVAVKIDRPGRVSLRGVTSSKGRRLTVLSAARDATAAGTVRLAVRLSSAGRRALRRAGKLAVVLTARFGPALEPDSATVRLTVPRDKAARRPATATRIGGRS
ncbi:MAG: hypothetical protein ACJ762_06180 [Solirubrobacteraceae bacterium]